jgi:hypothetical protein
VCLITAGCVAGFAATASASGNNCTATVAAPTCSIDNDATNPDPNTLQLLLTNGNLNDSPSYTVSWTSQCSDAQGVSLGSWHDTVSGTMTDGLPMHGVPVTTPSGATACTIQATLTASLTDTNTLYMIVQYTELEDPATVSPSPSPSASPAPAPTPSPSPAASPAPAKSGRIAGPAGKCADDSGNSRVKRAKTVLWTCSGNDQAERWTYASGELRHNGLCLNAKGYAANGSKIILWTCDGSPAEIWERIRNASVAVKDHGWTLCLTDPGDTAKNGTQLVLSTCHNGSGQHWSLP